MRITLTLMAAAVAACAALPAQATVLHYKNLDQLSKEADGVVVGTVRAVQAVGNAQGDVDTFVTVEAQEMLSGQLADKMLTLRLNGGFDGQRGLHIEGAPDFQVNERVLLFVQGNGRDLVPFVGWSQGVFKLVKDEQGAAERVIDADGQRVVAVRGADVMREGGEQSHVQLLGAPNLTVARSEAPQASAGVTESGAAATDVQVRAAPLPAMTLERFLEPVRASVGAGKLLQSVTTSDPRPAVDEPTQRLAERAVASPHRLAAPAAGGVSAPVRRPAAPASSGQR